MKLTVLNENTVYKKEYKSEHGLSLLVESGGRHILFDAGQTDVFLHNAKVRRIDLNDIDAVVLSHGHYDHTGGISKFCNEKKVPIFLQKSALCPKFSLQKEKYYFNGIPWLEEKPEEIILLENKFQEIFPGFYLLSQIPYITEFEHPNPRFFIECAGEFVPDQMQDEQILVVNEGEKVHIIAGCSHPGIINCIYDVLKHFPKQKLGCIIAGMHLIDADEERMNETIHALKRLDFEMLIPIHCTGMYGIMCMKEVFKERCRTVSTGDVIEV